MIKTQTGVDMKIDAFNKIIDCFTYQEGLQGREDFFNSVVMVLIMPVGEEYHFVFQKRSANIRQGGEVCFPGGRLDEADKNLLTTALRETKEEMGIPEDRIQVVGRLYTVITPSGVMVDSYIGITDVTMDEIKINEQEVDYFFTIPISYFIHNEPTRFHTKVTIQPSVTDEQGNEVILFPARELGLPERYWKSWGNFNHEILVYQTDQGVIWGITARLVYECVKLINSRRESE
jgi:8-oxo-dGTP pyrophosphatase MutT (NUDIX family)